MNAPKESGSCNVSELCPWGRSQGLGEEPGVRGGEKRTFGSGNETETKAIRRGCSSLDQEKSKTHIGTNSLTDINIKVNKKAQL